MTIHSASLGLRQSNRLRVIETLYNQPGTSRAELARTTGLSRATVSMLVEELEEANIVEEHDAGEDIRPRNTGRPPIPLSLVPSAAFAVGLDVGRQHIRVAVCDLSGRPVLDEWSPAEVDHAPMESLDLAYDLVRSALDATGVEPDRLLGVGMGLAAPINTVTGELEAYGILPGWDGIRPAAEMEQRLGVSVQLDNDANLGALGEKVFGVARGVDDLIYVRLSAGVGAGLVLNGRPYHGARGVAGEIGHVSVVDNGLICRCGNRGCLETVASPVAVAALLGRSSGRHVSVAELLDLVRLGDRGAQRAVSDAGALVGRALAMLVNTLNPELVVVGGELAGAGAVLLDSIRSSIERNAVMPASGAVNVTAGTLGDRAEVLGAAALILAQSPRVLARRVA
jgi:predicted NBD/HSP70 family sugar kinase